MLVHVSMTFLPFRRVTEQFDYIFTASLQDGGCTCPGDVAKAFGKLVRPSRHKQLLLTSPRTHTYHLSLSLGAGADFVMLGGMFAGHDQSGGELIVREGKKYKLFYGMSSSTAMKKYSGGVADYR